MQTLHKKVVDFDGDIPMEKLLAIQQKLKTKNVKEEQEKSFTEGNIIKSSNQGKPLFAKVSANQKTPVQTSQPSQIPTKVVPESSKQKQDTIAANSFWATGSANTASNPKQEASKVVAFDDFFGAAPSKPQPKTQAPNQSDMYDFFFPVSEQKPEQKPQQKKSTETNLLDL